MATSIDHDLVMDVSPMVRRPSSKTSEIRKDIPFPVPDVQVEGNSYSNATSSELKDSENVSSYISDNYNNVESSFPRLKVRIYGDSDDEGYNSSPQTSTELTETNSVSPTESFKEFFAHAEAPAITFNRALMKLNELESGKASLDTSVLQNTSEEVFRFHVMELALVNQLPLDDETILEILKTLSPFVQASSHHNRETLNMTVGNAISMPTAKLTDHDDDDHDDDDDDDDDDDHDDDDYRQDGSYRSLSDVDISQSEGTQLSPCSAQGPPTSLANDHWAPEEVEVALNCRVYSNQQYIFEKTSNVQLTEGGRDMKHVDIETGKLVACVDELMESYECKKDEAIFKRKEEIMISKSQTCKQAGVSVFDDTHDLPSASLSEDANNLSARSSNWGSTISPVDSWVFFSRLNNQAREVDDAIMKLQGLHLRLLRVALRLGQSKNNMVAQVLYRLEQAYYLRGGLRLSQSDLETMWLLAQQQEARFPGDLDLECTIMVLGKSGAGKSATINSLFGNMESVTDAYKPGTTKVKEIVRTVHGLKLRVIDTPGFSSADMHYNDRILSSIKSCIKNSPPDIVLYVDRLDLQCRDYGDLALFHAITDTLGVAIWYNTVIIFTHGSSVPLDGSDNIPVDYELFLSRKVYVLQETICQAARDSRLLNPVSIVENHSGCQIDTANHNIRPVSEAWRQQLLFLCFASKTILIMNKILNLQGKAFDIPSQFPSLPFLLALLLQSRAYLKHQNKQTDSDDLPFDGETFGSMDQVRYRECPPYGYLTRKNILLENERWRSYNDKLNYREKIMSKQFDTKCTWVNEQKGWLNTSAEKLAHSQGKDPEGRNVVAAPIMMCHTAQHSFSAEHSHTYPIIVQPSTMNKNNDDYLNAEKSFRVVKKHLSVSGRILKDKKKMNMQIECTKSLKGACQSPIQAGLDKHLHGSDMFHEKNYFKGHMQHICTFALAAAKLGQTLAAGLKFEDCLVVSKGLDLIIGSGLMTCQKHLAYGGHFEACFKDIIIDRSLTSMGVSLMSWQGCISIDGNLQFHLMPGQTVISGQVNFNNLSAGRMVLRANSLDSNFHMGLIGILPLFYGLVLSKVRG